VNAGVHCLFSGSVDSLLVLYKNRLYFVQRLYKVYEHINPQLSNGTTISDIGLSAALIAIYFEKKSFPNDKPEQQFQIIHFDKFYVDPSQSKQLWTGRGESIL